jgi:predicted sulfurtransferase
MEGKEKHMKELLKTKRITIAVIAFLLIIVLGLLTFRKPKNVYKITPIEMLGELPLIYQVTPEEAWEVVYDTTIAVFVDIRNVYDFEKGHFDNAWNISIPNLLDKESTAHFDTWQKDSLLVVMYGNSELQATPAWMLMYELGYTNTRVLLGGYDFANKFYMDELAEGEVFFVEDPAFDFVKVIKDAKSKSTATDKKEEPKKQVIIRKKVKKAAEGGC